MNEKGFDIIISNDPEYEELCSEIYYNGEFIAILSQENGIENAIIELGPSKNKWIFNYSEFSEILKEAYENLK